MTPQQINQMSMWQFWAMVAGAMEESNSLSQAEADDIWEWLKAS
ncbi:MULTISPECIES: hypothetical protein [unclassified Bradyrhizobium]